MEDVFTPRESTSADDVRIGRFDVDVTPEIGDPIAYGEAAGIDDPLRARGIVLIGRDAPIVLASVDWIGNGNAGYDAWRERLADAARTSPERVAVHTVHQHQTPWFDYDAIGMVLAHGARVYRIDPSYARETVERVAAAVETAVTKAEPVTHVGVGTAAVENVASNRQLIDGDDQIARVRFSSESEAEWRDAPEGLIDPTVSLVSFWREDTPVAALSYYACHPQSYYRDERVTCDFPGIARGTVSDEIGVPLVHFCGAAGNVTAGKYNDGSPENRPVLARRLADGLVRAWNDVTPVPVTAADVTWGIERVGLPPAAKLVADELASDLAEDSDYRTARKLAWLSRCERGHEIPVTCLGLGDTRIVHAPGELFVEYQIAAKRMRPDLTVAMAAYGDLGPMYIGTEDAYPMGGYEVDTGSLVASDAETPLTNAIRDLLDASDSTVTPSDVTAEKVRLEDA